MNSQVIEKIKEILGITEEVVLETPVTNPEEIKLMDWTMEDGRTIKIASDNTATIDGEPAPDGDWMVTNPSNPQDIKVLRIKDGVVAEIIDAQPTDTAPAAPVSSDTPTLAELYADYEELSTLVEDLTSRLAIVESMMMQSQVNQEKLASVIEVIKNVPSGEPIVKTEASEFSFRKKNNPNSEEKFYNLGKKLRK